MTCGLVVPSFFFLSFYAFISHFNDFLVLSVGITLFLLQLSLLLEEPLYVLNMHRKDLEWIDLGFSTLRWWKSGIYSLQSTFYFCCCFHSTHMIIFPDVHMMTICMPLADGGQQRACSSLELELQFFVMAVLGTEFSSLKYKLLRNLSSTLFPLPPLFGERVFFMYARLSSNLQQSLCLRLLNARTISTYHI